MEEYGSILAREINSIKEGLCLFMFINNTKMIKKLVTIVASSVCTILTIASLIAFIFSSDKRPFYVILPVVLFQDIVWILVYIFYVSRK